ncbi:MAG: hypothetical protein K940chlam3_00678 [Chlamydiae bacterium]|nr:hypothetical protein [Chlamydiota bacterium]
MIPEKVDLFLGYPVSQELAALIDSIPADRRDLYIQSTGEYLTEIQIDNHRYLGKSCGNLSELENLTLLEENIYTLLEKVVPDFPYTETPLTLFPITD